METQKDSIPIRVTAIIAGITILLLFLKTLKTSEYMEALNILMLGSVFLIYGLLGNKGIAKWLPWVSKKVTQPVFGGLAKALNDKKDKPSFIISTSSIAGQLAVAYAIYALWDPKQATSTQSVPDFIPWLSLVAGIALMIPGIVFSLKNAKRKGTRKP